jgi:hypothetical protein
VGLVGREVGEDRTMTQKTRRTFAPALVAAVISALLLTASPIAASDRLPFRISGAVTATAAPATFGGPSVRRATDAQASVDFSFVRYYVVKAAADGSYSFTLEATSGQAAVATELAFDAERREQLIAVGTPTAASLQRLRAIYAASTRSSSAGVASAGGTAVGSTVQTVAALKRGHDFYGTFWTDPIGITVNDVVDEARFYYDGVHVSSLTGGDGRQWLSANGWWEVAHSISAYYNAAHTLGTISTYDHFRTSSWFPFPFCGTTDVYYSNNKVYAYPDGHPGGAVNTWQTGTCGFLLSYTAMAFFGD